MKAKILGLQELLKRYGRELQFTDKQYRRYKVRRGLWENKDLPDFKDIDIDACVEKGLKLLKFLKNRRAV